MKFDQTMFTVVDRILSTGNIPFLLGEPGIGKSSWVEALASLQNTSCFTLPCNQLAAKEDITGARSVPTGKKDKDGNEEWEQIFFPHAIIKRAIDYALDHPKESPILFLDEINRTAPDVTSAILSMSTTKSIGSYVIPKNLNMIIAGNDKGNINTLDEASISRYIMLYVEPDANTFLSLEINDDLNPFIKAVLENNQDLIFCKKVENQMASSDYDPDDDEQALQMDTIDDIFGTEGEMQQFTTPRTITALSKFLNTFTNQELNQLLAYPSSQYEDKSQLEEIIIGYVGQTKFTLLLMDEIVNGINKTDNQKNSLTIIKPKGFDDMTNAKTIDDLVDYIDTLDKKELSTYLLYSLYDSNDNRLYIEKLSDKLDMMEPDAVTTLMKLSTSGQLDEDNIHALLQTKSPLANRLEIIFSANA